MSAQVSKLSINKPIRNVYEVSQSNRYTHDGNFIDRGVRTYNGSIFIEIYPDNKCRSDSVKTYWEEIRNSRGNDGNNVIKKKKNTRKQIKRERHKLVKITSQVEQLGVKRKVVKLSVS